MMVQGIDFSQYERQVKIIESGTHQEIADKKFHLIENQMSYQKK